MRGLDQDELGDVSPKTVRRIEQNQTPRPTTLRKIADALDVDPDEIDSY